MGNHKYIKTPDDLLKMWEDYKAYIDSTPDQIQKATNKGVQIELVDKPYQRKGFQAYVFRNYKFHVHQYIDNYENAYSEYLGVVTYMRDEWEENQVSGTLPNRGGHGWPVQPVDNSKTKQLDRKDGRNQQRRKYKRNQNFNYTT